MDEAHTITVNGDEYIKTLKMIHNIPINKALVFMVWKAKTVIRITMTTKITSISSSMTIRV